LAFVRHTDKKAKKIFLIVICKEIQMESGAKSNLRKGFLIYEEMRKYLTKCVEAFSHTYMTVQPIPSAFPYI
jgi:hypothetical protein